MYDKQPSALTQEDQIALYQDGVYEIRGLAFKGAIADRLGDDYRPNHRAACEEFTAGKLHNAGRVLPTHTEHALLNVANGMLDLVTGTLKPHDPVYLSSVQFPIEWIPEATCPTYEEWIRLVGIEDQIDDLEEITSLMLDPSRTPTKAVFLFGPSRSGKGTFLRIMESIAGLKNVSGVSLKQLSDNEFGAANVYGMALNVSGDLSASHIEDLSLFKMLTGEDLIMANRKFGKQFVFRNKALFAFSANELPTVGEASRAYIERARPFKFSTSFAGREDPSIEAKIIADELPGVLVRWVRAWQRLAGRGTYRQTNPEIRAEFETRSDRVRQWIMEEMAIALTDSAGTFHAVAGTSAPALLAAGTFRSAGEGQEVPAALVSTATELVAMFASWARANGSSISMGRNKLFERLTSMDGIERVRREGTGARGLNVVRRSGGDPWEGGEPPPMINSPALPALLDPVDNLPRNENLNRERDSLPRMSHSAEKTAESAGSDLAPPEMIMTFTRDGSAALDALLLASPVETRYEPEVCPDCDGPLTLVPFSPQLGPGFWYACARCSPATFART